ncbi:SUC1 Probable sucrose utilization protein SUC1 [Candida maltosa Xu316]
MSRRSPYTRPCDSCSIRKVKCDLNVPCSRCVTHDIECTNKRVKKKCGPKKIHEKTRQAIKNLNAIYSVSSDTFVPLFPLDKLLPCLNTFQTWYYGIWPVVSVAEISARVAKNDVSAYALSCAISAAILNQIVFISNNGLYCIPEDVKYLNYVSECIRARTYMNYQIRPNLETLLTSFFLHVAEVNKGSKAAGVIYLREAITMAQVIGLHNEATYQSKPIAEAHRMRKVYFMLMVTERFVCIDDLIPVVLENSVKEFSLDDEEYSVLIEGFKQLVRVFAIPSKAIFDMFIQLNDASSMPPGASALLNRIQLELDSIGISCLAPDIQKANIMVSKYWMKALTWKITRSNNLLDDFSVGLSVRYPLEMARCFLLEIKELPLSAFESNGPGVGFKLLTMATGLIDAINLSGDTSGYDLLQQIFDLISKLKNTEIILPRREYEQVKEALSKVRTDILFNSAPQQGGYISEVDSNGSLDAFLNDSRVFYQDGNSGSTPPIAGTPNFYPT